MERDALLAHGTSFLLQDRLMNCSDYSTSYVCRTCGSIISLGYDDAALAGVQTIDASTGATAAPAQLGPNGEYCRICRAEDELRREQGQEPLTGRRMAKGGQVVRLGPESLIKRGSGGLDVIVSMACCLVHVRCSSVLFQAVPYVLKYLAAELASAGMRISFEIA
jgi:DNA-directed RNA polymerase I subunit RPA2